MNLSYFIARRISTGLRGGFSSTIHRIAIASIAIGLMAAILSFLVMEGFQGTIKHKIYTFSSHILITKYTLNNSTEEQPFSINIDLYNHPEKYAGVDHVQEYAHKAGLIRTDKEILGVVLEGVGRSFDQERFKENLKEGSFIHFSDSGYSHDVVLSEAIASKLNLKVGDDVMVHFFQNPPRLRKLHVSGIYETDLSDYFDSKVILGDIRLIQRLNGTGDSIAGGLQVFVKDETKIAQTAALIEESMDYDLYGEQASETYIHVFEWLGLVGRQVYILLGIILAVVCVNMISVILILVMERTQMIGMMKAMGATNRRIRSIFVWGGINLILRGLALGNVLGLGLCCFQYKFKFIKLNAHDYYMNYVPISWNWQVVLLLNLLVFGVVSLVLLLPTAIVSRISPMKAIRFD